MQGGQAQRRQLPCSVLNLRLTEHCIMHWAEELGLRSAAQMESTDVTRLGGELQAATITMLRFRKREHASQAPEVQGVLFH